MVYTVNSLALRWNCHVILIIIIVIMIITTITITIIIIIRMVTFEGGNITECSYRGVWNDSEG